MTRRWPILHVLGFWPLLSASAQPSADTTRICLAPATVETAVGNAADAVNAVRETFTGYLTGPSLGALPLSARLQSQAREEAKAAACPYLLLPTVKHVRKSGGGGLLRRMAGGAAQQGAWSAGAAAGSTVGGIAAGAAAGAAGVAAYDYASWVRTKDEMTLTYRLESAAGKVLLEKSEKRKAQSDGEDLLTPLVQNAAEAVVAAAAKQPH
jgi:hypothetical protein